MKHLSQYVYEGIFNVDKNVTDTHEIEKSMFDDYNSDFWRYAQLVSINGYTSFDKNYWDHVEKSIDIDKEIIDIPDYAVQLNTKMQNPFSNKYTLKCKCFFIGNPTSSGPHPEPINNGGGFKKICAQRIQIDGFCEKLGGFDFDVMNEQRGSDKPVIVWPDQLDYFDVSFNFKHPEASDIAFRYMDDFPDLKNVKSNTTQISLYDPSLFDGDSIKSKLEKFFGGGKISAKGIVKNKSLRNLIAVVNNIKKYGSVDPENYKPVGKVSDLLDLRGLKDLKKILIRSNNVDLIFVRKDLRRDIEMAAKFLRLNNMAKYKDYKLDELVQVIENCKTDDDWIVIFMPENY